LCITFIGRGSQLPDRLAGCRSGRRRKLELGMSPPAAGGGVEVVGKADLK